MEMQAEQGPYLHLRIAEQGKLHALSQEFPLALAHYRHAMRMTAQAGDPEVFFRHYLECVVECLEQMGAYDEVLAWCDRAEAFFGDLDLTQNPVAQRDLAGVHQRRGVVLLRRGDTHGALCALQTALQIARAGGFEVPLAQRLAGWVRAGLVIERARLEAELVRGSYYSVRPETVDRAVALPLPRELLPLGS